jgi:hypothetical protein
MKTLLLPSAMLLALAANTMFAGSVCPAPYAGNSDGEGVSPGYIADTQISGTQASGTVLNNTGCNDLITFNSNGSINTTFPNANGFYDSGGDDNIVGIINNTSSAITSIVLSSTVQDIFGFDGDGPCATSAGTFTTTSPGYSFVGGENPCVNSIESPSGNTENNYGGPYVTYTGISGSDESGTVNFGNGGIAAGGNTWFGLEGTVDVNLQVGPGTPEPATFSLMGIAVCGLFLMRRIRKV